MHFHLDEHFWVGFSVILFVLFVYKPISRKLVSFLDKKIENIRLEISESESIKKEAEELMREYQIKLKESDHIVLKITKDAEDKISSLSEKFDIELNRISNEKIMLTDKRIKGYEDLMVYNARMLAVDSGLDAVSISLNDKNLREIASSNFIDSSYNAISH